jgi:hypothetical protein
MFLKMLFIINKVNVKVPNLITLVNIVYWKHSQESQHYKQVSSAYELLWISINYQITHP